MGAENFGLDIDNSSEGLGQSTEQSEKLNEAYREGIKSQQKAIKKIKRDEAKAKVFDDSLGDIIQEFLNEGGKDFIIRLISNLVEKNVPSDFILSIILPISFTANEKVIFRLKDRGVDNLGLSVQIEDDFRQKIFDWVNMIYSVAIIEKEGVLDSIIDSNTWKPIPGLDKLFLEVLKILLIEKDGEDYQIGDFERNISLEVFERIIEKLEGEIE